MIMAGDNGNIKLSVCIATYNRAGYIGETLESIISQLNEYVEILVVDGASTDDTKSIVEGYARSCAQLRYVRLPCKGGVDQDYAKAVELACGEYCWLMTDDDILKVGAIKRVLDSIDRKYGLIIVNAEVRDVELKSILEERRLKFDEDRRYGSSDFRKFFIDTAFFLTFIGCVVIKKKLWDERDKARYFGSLFIHVGVVFQEPIREDILVIAAPLISIRYANAQWKARGFEIWMFKWPELVWSFNIFSDADKSRVYRREQLNNLKLLVLYRGTGAYSKKEYDMWIKPRFSSGWRKLLAKLITLVPGNIVNCFCVTYLSIFGQKSDPMLVDLKDSPNCLFSHHG